MTRVDYRAGSHLPDSIELYGCAQCDSAFTMPRDAKRYDAYYRELQNDVLGDFVQTPDSLIRYQLQADALKSVLDTDTPLRVVDFGCGQGGLLRHLCERFPQHTYFGLDTCATITKIGDITLVDEVAKLEGTFNVAISSHVFEHLIDFSSVDALVERIAPNGAFYIEVPDPGAYGEHLQREYLFYVDRTHVTHFSPTSLARLAQRWRMGIASRGEFAFPYKGGTCFPAQYVIASRTVEPTTSVGNFGNAHTLKRFDAYLQSENERFADLAKTIGSAGDLVIYGFGDNFQRARSAQGPLAGASIKAIVDRRWQELNRDFGDKYTFMSLDDAVSAHADLPFVVTVSWGGEEIAAGIRSQTRSNVFVL